MTPPLHESYQDLANGILTEINASSYNYNLNTFDNFGIPALLIELNSTFSLFANNEFFKLRFGKEEQVEMTISSAFSSYDAKRLYNVQKSKCVGTEVVFTVTLPDNKIQFEFLGQVFTFKDRAAIFGFLFDPAKEEEYVALFEEFNKHPHFGSAVVNSIATKLHAKQKSLQLELHAFNSSIMRMYGKTPKDMVVG